MPSNVLPHISSWADRLPGLFNGTAARRALPQTEFASQDHALYTLQVAVYTSRASAQMLSENIAGSWIEEVREADRLKFRVNYRHFDTRHEAQKMQPMLSQRGFRSVVRCYR